MRDRFGFDRFTSERLQSDASYGIGEGVVWRAYLCWAWARGVEHGSMAELRRFLEGQGCARAPGKRLTGIRLSNSDFGRFYSEALDLRGDARTGVGTLVRHYNAWARATGLTDIIHDALRGEFRARGHAVCRIGGRRKAIAGVVPRFPWLEAGEGAADPPPNGSSRAPTPQSRGGKRDA